MELVGNSRRNTTACETDRNNIEISDPKKEGVEMVSGDSLHFHHQDSEIHQ